MPPSDQGLQPDRYQLIPRVLCFVTHGREVLLIKGAAAKRVWPNKHNGVGGHVERGEDFRSAARREIAEETGLAVRDLIFRGAVNIDADQHVGIGLFVFTAVADDKNTVASGEGSLEWIAFDRIGEVDLVEDLPELLPRVLAMGDDEPPFFARYGYDAEGKLKAEFGN